MRRESRLRPTAPVDVFIGPNAPAGKESNWIPTSKDTPLFPLLRFYGPLETWIDRSWKPGDLEVL
jgi:hypothetical protein